MATEDPGGALLSVRDAVECRYTQRDRLESSCSSTCKKGNVTRSMTWTIRLKDILDALQGRFGGPKAVRPLQRLIRERQSGVPHSHGEAAIQRCSAMREAGGY